MNLNSAETQAVRTLANEHKIDMACLMAVIQVESAGVPYTVFPDGSKRPVIRFEGHYFDKLVDPKKQAQARKAGLANPKAGAVKNPKSQASRYKLFEKAAKIDRAAAIASVSWGVGQVMGSHWQELGFRSAEALYQSVMESFAGQVDLMVKFIVHAGLLDELQRHDWSAFARGYNGPAYKKNAYDTHLAAAYADWAGSAAPKSSASGMVRMGSTGKAVREVQTLLVRAGYSVKVDGDFGPSTRDAVKDFQKARRLGVDGVVGPETMRSLNSYRQSPAEDVGATPILENDGVRNGALSTIGGVSAATAADKISGIADKIGTTGVHWFDLAVNGLYMASAALVIGGVVYAAYGYMKDGKTSLGVG